MSDFSYYMLIDNLGWLDRFTVVIERHQVKD
ncbi:hypothetical protein SAMN05444001_102222 [Parabacteroides chinchillae]|uniref:Uncharacterized protein n=1 Tax=Parabacteroides chinchillae TaxID=871327 RepID=A0A8G2BUH9_9BACT|nr:hypothetical protein SAMN05444001_102222 [Parabacteroides chinchillae]